MAKRMLIDATHPEETRVVVLNGNRLEEFDFETSTKRQVKGNIYLAKVTRVEPSLQAAFVEYGGNRHGFLAFSEIHSDYYRIPIGDRKTVDGEFQPAELARFEASGEAAEEAGVPLDEALPEPVTLAAIESNRDDDAEDGDDPTDQEASAEPGSPTRELVTNRPVLLAEDETERKTGARAGEELSSNVPGTSEVEPAPPSPHDSGSPPDGSGELLRPPVAPERGWPDHEPSPASAWFAVSTADEVIVSSETPPDEPGPNRSIVVVADPELPAADEGHDTGEIPETTDSADREMRASETSELPERSGSEYREREFGEEPISAGPGGVENEGLARVASADYPGNNAGGAEPHAGDNGEGAAHHLSEAPGADVGDGLDGDGAENETIETLGGDEFEEVETQRSRIHRHYKIQEVIKRRQIMLVQVIKEERGNKGAALTTYLSLAGRYCVLMPNTARGGGVSRKITNLGDRRRLKEILEELDIPEGMGVIVRTAGAERSKAEIKRDYEYLLRLWNEIRELTLRSTAPALIYEEGDLIKRSIRDLYTRDIEEVLVEGEEGYRTAKAFMKMLMPSHAKRVQPYRDAQIGLLHRFQVESQIDAIHSPVVQLRSGGYVVIDQTEALVAIDVNSGRATRERNIEETALRTNLEAAEEIARQLRLRDLAGLIVIDFIDMEEHRNQAAVERRLKEALRSDRARIQVGRISPFGLLEMSRQRLRSSLAEASTQPCPHCGGTGFIRSTESTALYVLRSIEEEGMRRRSAEVCVYVPTTVALYILNHKRDSLAQLETRYSIHVLVARDDSLIPPAFRLERLRAFEPAETAISASPPLTQALGLEPDDVEEELGELLETEDVGHPGSDGDEDRVRARRRRRRRRRHDEERGRAAVAGDENAEEPAVAAVAAMSAADGDQEGEEDGEGGRLRRRRGRRGGRRRGRREESAGSGGEIGRAAADSVEIVPADAAPPGDGGFEPDEGAAAAAANQDWWSRPAAAEPSAASEIETASLPALAGEAAPAAPSALADEPALPASETAVAPGGEIPFAPPGTDMFGSNQHPSANQASGVAAAETSEPDLAARQDTISADTEPATEAVSEAPSPPEIRPAANEQNEPTEIVEEVKNKPENPRRGWWQRLIQS